MLGTGFVADFIVVMGPKAAPAPPRWSLPNHVGMPDGRGADLCAQYFARRIRESGETGGRGKSCVGL